MLTARRQWVGPRALLFSFSVTQLPSCISYTLLGEDDVALFMELQRVRGFVSEAKPVTDSFGQICPCLSLSLSLLRGNLRELSRMIFKVAGRTLN